MPLEVLAGAVVLGFLAVLAFGLVTGRIPWRQQACCTVADPARDKRMRDALADDIATPRQSASS